MEILVDFVIVWILHSLAFCDISDRYLPIKFGCWLKVSFIFFCFPLQTSAFCWAVLSSWRHQTSASRQNLAEHPALPSKVCATGDGANSQHDRRVEVRCRRFGAFSLFMPTKFYRTISVWNTDKNTCISRYGKQIQRANSDQRNTCCTSAFISSVCIHLPPVSRRLFVIMMPFLAKFNNLCLFSRT